MTSNQSTKLNDIFIYRYKRQNISCAGVKHHIWRDIYGFDLTGLISSNYYPHIPPVELTTEDFSSFSKTENNFGELLWTKYVTKFQENIFFVLKTQGSARLIIEYENITKILLENIHNEMNVFKL